MHRIGVLMGGWGEEREISLKTGEAIATALESHGHDVARITAGPGLDETIRKHRIDVAFLALHGRMGEDGKVQGLLEVLGIPYTGSGVTASAIAMNKPIAKRLFREANLATASGCSLKPGDGSVDLGFPCIVKPALGGSSVGLTLVHEPAQLDPAIRNAARFGGEALVERYVEGREVTVAILGDEVLGSLEVSHPGTTFDYATKYESGAARYHLPPRMSPTRVQNVEAMALRAYRALGCRGYARVDFICSESSGANDVLLEVNTLPGMTATSLLPKIAARAGLDFPALCERILELASLDEAPQGERPQAACEGAASPTRNAAAVTESIAA
jgi:D-alanine-D-alanine ligase